jgi:uncharacterized membrane protein
MVVGVDDIYAVRWDAGSNRFNLGPLGEGVAANTDGTIIVGNNQLRDAFVWTYGASGGTATQLRALLTGVTLPAGSLNAVGMSEDGKVIVGSGWVAYLP